MIYPGDQANDLPLTLWSLTSRSMLPGVQSGKRMAGDQCFDIKLMGAESEANPALVTHLARPIEGERRGSPFAIGHLLAMAAEAAQ